jgi:hypothetical protein
MLLLAAGSSGLDSRRQLVVVYRRRVCWRRVGSVIRRAAAASWCLAPGALGRKGRQRGQQRRRIGGKLGIRRRGVGARGLGCQLAVGLIELHDEAGLDFAGAIDLTLKPVHDRQLPPQERQLSGEQEPAAGAVGPPASRKSASVELRGRGRAGVTRREARYSAERAS